MKKITLLLLLLFTITTTSWAQRFHTLQDLGPDITFAISIECANRDNPIRVLDLNLNQNFKLQVNQIYKADIFGEGQRYYKVTVAYDYGLDKGSDVELPVDFGQPITDFCNSLSWKYARPILIGATLKEAQNNYCNNATANNTREKVNIKTTNPLITGNVYYMNFGKGANYYIIDGSNVGFGDSEYQLDPTTSNSVFSSITFNCQKPDLRATRISLNNYDSAYRGTYKYVEFTTYQLGTDIQSAVTKFTFYLSTTNGIVTPSDIKVATGVWDAKTMNMNPNSIQGIEFKIPDNISNDKYYVTMEIANSEDFNPKNNIITTSFSFEVKDGNPTPTPTQTPTQTQKPDLTIDSNNTIILSECFDCSPTLSELGSKRHKINNQSGILNLSFLAVKNAGNAASPPTNITFYLSSDSTFDSADLKSNKSNVKINAIASLETSVVSGLSIFSSDFGNIGTKFTGNWNILMVVDGSKIITESNENNNITVIPVTFYNPFGKLASNKFEIQEFTDQYSIDVYNFQGQKVLTKQVNNIVQENKSLEELKKGIYIIKSKNGTRKVAK
jgi:hypothetical protein